MPARDPGPVGAFLAQLIAGFETLINRILGRLSRTAADRVRAHGTTVTADDLKVIKQLWNDQVDAAVVPALTRIWATSANRAVDGLTDLQREVAALTAPDPAAFMRDARNRLAGIGDIMWDDIREQLAAGIEDGDSIPDLADRVAAASTIAGPRATVIARTEVISVHNAAGLAQARMLDDPAMVKEWLATPDDRTRHTHRQADGQRVRIGEPFTVGDAKLDFPGDPDGPPGEVISCRCSMAFDVDDIPLAASGYDDQHDVKRDTHGKFAHVDTRGAGDVGKVVASVREALKPGDNATYSTRAPNVEPQLRRVGVPASPSGVYQRANVEFTRRYGAGFHRVDKLEQHELSSNVVARVSNAGPDSVVLSLNPSLTGPTLSKNERIGHFAPGTGHHAGLLTHELGHALLQANLGGRDKRKRADALAKAHAAATKAGMLVLTYNPATGRRLTPEEYATRVASVSKYANGNADEAVAELFAHYHWGGDKRPAWVKAWGETLHHELGLDPTPLSETIGRDGKRLELPDLPHHDHGHDHGNLPDAHTHADPVAANAAADAQAARAEAAHTVAAQVDATVKTLDRAPTPAVDDAAGKKVFADAAAAVGGDPKAGHDLGNTINGVNRFSDSTSGMSTRVVKLTPHKDRLEANVDITGPGGKPVGKIVEKWRRDNQGLITVHQTATLDPGVAGGGFTQRLQKSLDDGYRKAGVGIVYSDPKGLRGYGVAMSGWDFEGAGTMKNVAAHFAAARDGLDPATANNLDALLARATPAHFKAGTAPTPFDFAMLGHEHAAGDEHLDWPGKTLMMSMPAWRAKKDLRKPEVTHAEPGSGGDRPALLKDVENAQLGYANTVADKIPVDAGDHRDGYAENHHLFSAPPATEQAWINTADKVDADHRPPPDPADVIAVDLPPSPDDVAAPSTTVPDAAAPAAAAGWPALHASGYLKHHAGRNRATDPHTLWGTEFHDANPNVEWRNKLGEFFEGTGGPDMDQLLHDMASRDPKTLGGRMVKFASLTGHTVKLYRAVPENPGPDRVMTSWTFSKAEAETWARNNGLPNVVERDVDNGHILATVVHTDTPFGPISEAVVYNPDGKAVQESSDGLASTLQHAAGDVPSSVPGGTPHPAPHAETPKEEYDRLTALPLSQQTNAIQARIRKLGKLPENTGVRDHVAAPSNTRPGYGEFLVDDVDWKKELAGIHEPDNVIGQADEKMAAIAHRQGFDGLPATASPENIDALVNDGGIELFRGTDSGHADQFLHGDYFAGYGASGSGIYASTAPTAADSYAAGHGEHLSMLRMVLSPDANTASLRDIRKDMDSRPGLPDDLESNEGRYAAAAGYDAVSVKRPDGSTTWVVLNRSALTVQEGGGTPVRGSMPTAADHGVDVAEFEQPGVPPLLERSDTTVHHDANFVGNAVSGPDALREPTWTAYDDIPDDGFAGVPAESIYAAIGDYTAQGYHSVNNDLRLSGGKPSRLSKTDKAMVKALDAAMKDSPLKNDVVVYRGIRQPETVFGDSWSDDMSGVRWQDHGFVSTTSSPDLAQRFTTAAPVLVRVKVPAGTKAITVSFDESEVLLNRGLKFVVVADHGSQDGIRHLDVEVIP